MANTATGQPIDALIAQTQRDGDSAGSYGTYCDSQTVAAAGSTQANGTAITAQSGGFVLVSAADATKGVILPPARAGYQLHIKNNAAAILKVWPASGDAINAIAADTNIAMASLTSAVFTAYDDTTWYTTPLLPS